MDIDEEGQQLKGKGDRKPSGDDPMADWLLKNYYRLCSD